MLSNIKKLKDDLKELADVINSFKSETVQLKILELLFKHDASEVKDSSEELPEQRSRTITKKRPIKFKSAKETKGQTRKTGKLGPVTALNQLAGGNFFNSKKKIGDIVKYCGDKLATKVKPSDLSGHLARLIREKKLDREKNKEGQFEYFKPK